MGRKWGYQEQTPTLTPGGSLTSEWHKPDVVTLMVSDGKAETFGAIRSSSAETVLPLPYSPLTDTSPDPTHRCMQSNVWTHVVL